MHRSLHGSYPWWQVLKEIYQVFPDVPVFSPLLSSFILTFRAYIIYPIYPLVGSQDGKVQARISSVIEKWLQKLRLKRWKLRHFQSETWKSFESETQRIFFWSKTYMNHLHRQFKIHINLKKQLNNPPPPMLKLWRKKGYSHISFSKQCF